MKTLLLIPIGLIFFIGFAALASERCIMCGMDACKSETKFVVQLVKGTKEVPAGKYSFCCLHCLVIFKARIKDGKINNIMARDYSTAGKKYDSGKMIDAAGAYYLIESRLRPKGSMVPFMLIFSDLKTAAKYQKVGGGKILNWKEVWAYTKP